MTVVHIVQFRFKEDTSSEAIQAATAAFLGLKDNCIHPETQKPYIISATGGKDNSKEGMQNGIQYIFVIEFDNLADRDYYTETDPAHSAFVKNHVHDIVEKVIVVDFSKGVF